MAATPLPLLVTDLTRDGPIPLHRQLYETLRRAILDGRLAPGSRLPATRALALELDVSRNTVLAAYDQLHAEGYLDGRIGAGSFVNTQVPEPRPPARETGGAIRAPLAERALTEPGARGRLLSSTAVIASVGDAPRAFRHGVPALDAFPIAAWSRLIARAWRDVSPRAPRLRRCRRLPAAARSHRRLPAHGARGALRRRPGDRHERRPAGAPSRRQPPARARRRGLVRGSRLPRRPHRAPGRRRPPHCRPDRRARASSIDDAEQRAPHARAVYVTPSHQYPLGVTMSLGRRLQLLAWASRQRAWIVEDDYDSEYRYAGRPLASLQGLDRDDRVIYVGTFSKVLCPALRLGYIVVPPRLADAFVAARGVVDRHGASLDQIALARFIDEGQLARHIRRMRALYAERQDAARGRGGAPSGRPPRGRRHARRDCT